MNVSALFEKSMTEFASANPTQYVPDMEIPMILFKYPFEDFNLRRGWEFLLKVEQTALVTHLSGWFVMYQYWPRMESEAIFEIVCDFLFMPPDMFWKFQPPKLKLSGRKGYNAAMNGVYIRGENLHAGRVYYRHCENSFTMRWYEDKWVMRTLISKIARLRDKCCYRNRP